MARNLRVEYPGAVYHVISRGNAKQKIFLNDFDYSIFLGILLKTVKRFNWLCHAYCLMSNHYHLLIETPDGNLSAGMREVNGVYGLRFNKGHKRVGHVFQDRYKAILIEKEVYLLELCRYIVLNPVRAGIVESPGDYIWSSYRQTAGLFKKEDSLLHADWVLSQFGNNLDSARREYIRFVADGIDISSPFDEVQGRIVLGGDEFTKNIGEYLDDSRELLDIPRDQRFIDRPTLEELFATDIARGSRSRNQKIYDAHVRYGYNQKKISRHLGLHFSTISRIISSVEKNQ